MVFQELQANVVLIGRHVCRTPPPQCQGLGLASFRGRQSQWLRRQIFLRRQEEATIWTEKKLSIRKLMTGMHKEITLGCENGARIETYLAETLLCSEKFQNTKIPWKQPFDWLCCSSFSRDCFLTCGGKQTWKVIAGGKGMGRRKMTLARSIRCDE